jgi:hypothetical protein
MTTMTQGGLNQGVGLLRVYGLGFSEESELYSTPPHKLRHGEGLTENDLLRVTYFDNHDLETTEVSERYCVGHNKNEQALESIESYLH